MTLDNEQIVRKAYQIAEDKDLKGWADAFAADGTFTDNSIGVVYRGPDGPDGLPVQVENYARAFPDMHRELYQLHVSGDIWWSSWLSRELVDGKIKRFDCYPEGSIVLTQLGVIGNLNAALQH